MDRIFHEPGDTPALASNHITIELDDTTAQSIVNGLITTMGEWGFTLDFLKANLVAVTIVAVTVSVGNVNRVLQRLNDMISPEIITCHCVNHRLELAVGDTVKKVGGGVNHSRLVESGISIERPTSLSTDRKNTFRHVHASISAKRDMGFCYDQYNVTRRKDRVTGLHDLKFQVSHLVG
ncbi:unnamed protein product [Cyprideis torosa]|uniref:Uncharacterized protein n=1 Tax=Cyprideis torosa TaxID=163714 RepID=A0A7R8ZJL5_9CRUS|nr:unnamed protein product [Cyprideis torosa]CAG0888935.1 unnamed protein product [Cyprideis torosa]